MFDVSLLLHARAAAASNGAIYDRVNPITGETATRAAAGDPRKAKAPLGPVISLDAIERVIGLVRDAVAKGARLLRGGHANGVLMDATVLDHVTPAMRI